LAVVEPIVCQGREHLEKYFHQQCINPEAKKYAEGIVLRDPNAWYFKKYAFFTKKVCIQAIEIESSIQSQNDLHKCTYVI
jgi:hypothetical protein